MVYLVVKELSSIAEDVIMVTSSIMKDMQPNLEVIYRPNAIRALARIIDVSLYYPLYRLLRAELVARPNPFSLLSDSSSPLLSTVHLPSPLRPLSQPTTSSISHPRSSSAGPTRRKKQSMRKLLRPVEGTAVAVVDISEEAVQQDSKLWPVRATSCSITRWDYCI